MSMPSYKMFKVQLPKAASQNITGKDVFIARHGVLSNALNTKHNNPGSEIVTVWPKTQIELKW